MTRNEWLVGGVLVGVAAVVAVLRFQQSAPSGEGSETAGPQEESAGVVDEVVHEVEGAVEYVSREIVGAFMGVNFSGADLGNTNVKAMLRLIRQGESGQSDDAYRIIWGGSYFDSFADHPRRYFTTSDGRRTSAAGAYQITAKTWDWVKGKIGAADFSPASQDRAAVWLMAYRGALADVKAGRLEAAITKLRNEWTSLPGAMEQGYTFAKAKQVFLAYGGVLGDAPVYA